MAVDAYLSAHVPIKDCRATCIMLICAATVAVETYLSAHVPIKDCRATCIMLICAATVAVETYLSAHVPIKDCLIQEHTSLLKRVTLLHL